MVHCSSFLHILEVFQQITTPCPGLELKAPRTAFTGASPEAGLGWAGWMMKQLFGLEIFRGHFDFR